MPTEHVDERMTLAYKHVLLECNPHTRKGVAVVRVSQEDMATY